MPQQRLEQLKAYFDELNNITAEDMTQRIEQELTDEELELFVRHIEDFYDIEDDEEVGLLTQLMVTGYMAKASLRPFEPGTSLN